MTNVPDGWQLYRDKPEPERCSLCLSEDTHVWVGDPDESGPYDLLLCDTCYGWSQRLIAR